MTVRRAAAFLAAAWLLAVPAAAEEGDRQIRISADSMQWNEKTGTARASGNAVAEQTDARLSAETLIAHARAEDGAIGRIRLIEAEGGVTYETADERALGERGRYDLEAGRLALTGNVRLFRDGNELTGSELTIDLETGVSEIIGTGPGRAAVTFEAAGSGEGGE